VGETDDLVPWLRAEIEADRDTAAAKLRLSRVSAAYRRQLMEAADRADAELAILGEHGGEHMCFENTRDGNTWDCYEGDCRVVRQLGYGYRRRPGYGEAWRPDPPPATLAP
jgi:hypothetical protein